MVKLINAKCPNCGAILELPSNIDRALCIHCGGKVIVARDTHYHTHEAQKAAIACPECSGKGYFICNQCKGGGRCTAYTYEYRNQRPYMVYCQGGWCPKCKGRGEDDALIFSSRCNFCHGARVCPYCRGTNRCITCGGTGRIVCRACEGSGFKVYRGG
jgi:DnaJ-class molecular chaperone